jgi:dolichol-phosphate mannosyltransferase
MMPEQVSQEIELSIVIPAKDEAGSLPFLIKEIQGYLDGHFDYEIIVVDDGSRDQTFTICQQTLTQSAAPFLLIRNRKPCGQSTAIAQGAQLANGRYVLTMDADGQNDPKDIPTFIQLARKRTEMDFCIIGHRQQRQDSRWVRIQSKIANAIRSSILKDDTPDSGCALKLLPLRTFRKIPYFNHMHRFTPALVRRMGGATISVAISHRPRTAGDSHYNVWNRAFAGILDLCGVAWLLYRTRLPEVERLERFEP